MSEQENRDRLEEARSQSSAFSRAKEAAKNAKLQIGQALSFGKKLSRHWPMLIMAGFFDLLGAIPFLGVIFNLGYGLILFLYFGPKRKADEGSELMNIALPIFLGSALDLIISLIPVNIGATLFRIARSKETEEQ